MVTMRTTTTIPTTPPQRRVTVQRILTDHADGLRAMQAGWAPDKVNLSTDPARDPEQWEALSTWAAAAADHLQALADVAELIRRELAS